MKLVIFDFDGVIADTFSFSYQIMKEMDADLTEEKYRGYFDGNIYKAVDPADRIVEPTPFFQKYIPHLMECPPTEGIPEVLSQLKARGCSLVIVSSTMDEPIARFLEKHQLAGYFDGIYGATVSKSKEYKIRLVLEQKGIESGDAVFVTDTLGDIREGERVGVRSIGVSWGYHSAEKLQSGNPLAVVHRPEELLSAIE